MNTAVPDRNAWRRLLRNRSALFGLAIILCAVLVALFAYPLSPDGSPYANRMIIEIGGKKPGYTQQFLKLPLPEASVPKSEGFRWWSGTPDRFQYIPITGYTVQQDQLTLHQQVDDNTAITVTWPLDTLRNFRDNPQAARYTQTFYLGTDKYGRDILSRLLIGVRVSLSVGLVTVLISLTLGIGLGALAGFYRGRTDDIITWLINVIWSIPTLLLVFAFTLLLGKGFWQVLIAIGLTLWVNVARLIRGQILSVRELDYVEAARALGYSSVRILTVHVLPNVIGPVMVVAAANFASAIVIEAGISFLGIGVQPPQPSWGLMIKENFNFIITHNPMLALAPGFAIMLLVLAFNLLGNALRDAFAVRS